MLTSCRKPEPPPQPISLDVKIARDTVLLYFPTDCEKVDPFERPMPADPELVAQALLEGPNDVEQRRGATNPFPEGADVRSVKVEDGVLTIDFNQGLQNVGGPCAGPAIRNAVQSTFERLPGVTRVVITAGGAPLPR